MNRKILLFWTVVVLIVGAVLFVRDQRLTETLPQLPEQAARVDIDRQKAQEHADRGHEYVTTGRYAEGIRELNKVLEFYDREASVYFNLGYAYHALGNYEKAVEAYRKVLELDPANAGARKNLTLALDKLNQSRKRERDH